MSESLHTTETPVNLDNSDGTPGIECGMKFLSAVDGFITHLRFWATTNVGGTWTCRLYQVTAGDSGGNGAGNLLDSKVFPGTPVAGWNQVELDDPIAITANTVYMVSRHNDQGRYVNSNGVTDDWPLASTNLSAPADTATLPAPVGSIRQCNFIISATPAYPNDWGASADYFVDVVFELAAASEGTVDLGLNLAVDAAGAASHEGAAALGLNLAVDAAGAASHEGAAALGLNLAPVAAGARDSVGAAALGLGLGVVATGGRDSAGVAALGLRLAVNAQGSNGGQAGRPVTSFPWPPRPVKSFTEVTG